MLINVLVGVIAWLCRLVALASLAVLAASLFWLAFHGSNI